MGAGATTQAGSGPVTTADIAPDYGIGDGPRRCAPTTWMKVSGQIVFHVALTQRRTSRFGLLRTAETFVTRTKLLGTWTRKYPNW